MWISRKEHNRLLAEVEADAKTTIENIRSEVADALRGAETLVAKREAEVAALLEKADRRVSEVEAALQTERRENRRAERHWASMFLRKEKTFPLPKTAEEKEEAKAEVEEKKNEPIPLTDVQLSMRDANRREAARHGISEEDADRDFAKYMTEMME